MSLSRRSLLQAAAAGLAWNSLDATAGLVNAHTHPTEVDTLPFASGDVVVGCTLLNDATDDHKGRGRILHYDATLSLRQTLWLDDTTHIVQGLQFSPDGTLWAFDAFAYRIIWYDANARRRGAPTFPPRSFAHVNFATDGRYFLGENFVGDRSRVKLRTTLPFVPGTRRFGEGHLYEFSSRHELIRTHATPVHGGMGGFQGLTSSVLSKQDGVLIYTSESGPRIMRWDLRERRALPDLVAHGDDSGRMFFEVRLQPTGTLLVLTGLAIEEYTPDGTLLRSDSLGSFGWASMSRVRENQVYVSNFFSGELACFDLGRRQIVARTDTGMRRSASGIDVKP